jgi:hypothetical protein
MKFNLRDLFWFLLVIGFATSWCIERAKQTTAIPTDFVRAVEFARKNSHVGPSFRLARISQDSDGEFYILFSSGGPVSGGSERWRLKWATDCWEVIEHDVYDA